MSRNCSNFSRVCFLPGSVDIAATVCTNLWYSAMFLYQVFRTDLARNLPTVSLCFAIFLDKSGNESLMLDSGSNSESMVRKEFSARSASCKL